VLSVYLDGTATDPAIQRSWRTQLDHSLSDIRSWLEGSPRNERAQFEECVRLLYEQLASHDPGVGTPGWAAFITSDRVQDAQAVAVPVPTLAVWSTGICVAPYMRTLKEHRPVIVAVSDARKSDVHRYRLGRADLIETVRARAVVQPALHMGAAPRQGFHSGTRGATGHDAAQRSLLDGRDRMLAATVDRISELAGNDGWIVLGGIKRVVARLAHHLATVAPDRVFEMPALDVHASEAQIAHAARVGASSLRAAFDAKRVAGIIEDAGANGLGVIGAIDTRHALEQASVRELYVTRHYLEEHAAEAEDEARLALDQNASVEEVSDDAAEDLDRSGGIAASLRFRAQTPEASPISGIETSAAS
jgi:hypothetical protein